MRYSMTTMAALAILLLAGCASFYRQTGVSMSAGDVDAPVEVSDSSDILTVRALFSMTGVKVWSANGYAVRVGYRASSTNEYLWGMVKTLGGQDVTLCAAPLTNAVPRVADESGK